MSASSGGSAGKAIFVTGGGSGIGRAVAKHFADKGWLVGISDINEQGIRETAAMLPDGRTSQHRLDVRDFDGWQRELAAFAERSGGRLDVLFNNAGIGIGGPIESNRREDMDLLIDVNLRGVVYGAHAAYPYLAATAGSCLLNTASAAGIYGSAGLSVYSATKFAVRGLTEALDIEWADRGIRVRSLMPGFIDTPLLDGLSASDSNESTREVILRTGLELSPVERVAEQAWEAVHGPKVHYLVGETAKRLAFAAKWTPGRLRKSYGKIFGQGKSLQPAD